MKHWMSVVLAGLLLLSLLSPCALAEDASMAIIDASQNQDYLGMEIKIASAFEDADKLENYKVTLGGNELTLRSIAASEEKREPDDEEAVEPVVPSNDSGTSWIFLVDVSTVATDKTAYKLTATLNSLFGLIGKNDNAALVNTAMAYGPEYLTPEANRLTEQMKNGTTNLDTSADQLYDAVIKALDFLESNENAKAFKSLVVLSKGDNTNGSVSLDDVLNRIEASNVAVYTVAYIDSSSSREFGDMAQASIDKGNGGAAINTDTVGSSTIEKEAASVIRYVERKRKRDAGGFVAPEAESKSATEYLIKTDQPKEKGVDNSVVVSFSGKNMTVSDAYYVTADITYQKKTFMEWLTSGLKRGDIACVGIVAGAVVLLALILILIIRALRGKKDDDEDYNAGEVVVPPTNAVSQVERAVTAQSTVVDAPQKKRLQLSLRDATGKNYRAMLTPEGITAGRQADNHVVLSSEDKLISRHHFVLKQMGDEVVLESISETNGTFVNGMRIDGPIALRQQDVIRVGKTEMTVTWKYV